MTGIISEPVASAPPAPAAKPGRVQPRFPVVIWYNHRGYVQRGGLNRHKDELIAFAQGVAFKEIEGAYTDTSLVPLKQVAIELGVGRRTIGRRIEAAQEAAEAAA